jgi:manganese/zinc/iron transport system ATP- binding protein
MIIQADNPILEVHDLTVSYDKKPVLWGIDFSLPKGNLIGILGPNGSGKSTLLKSIMGLIPISSGYIKLFDKEIKDVRKKVSYVPQRESVDWDFPASVFEIVLMGRYGHLGLFKRPRKADKEMAMDALEKVGMTNFADRQISELSGGQQQRVFLARAIAQDAELYFMDEPFAGIDASTEKTIIELLRGMVRNGKTIVVVHHDLQSVSEYFDWLILLNLRLVASGPIEKTFTSENLNDTYGGKLTILTKLTEIMKKENFPSREN